MLKMNYMSCIFSFFMNLNKVVIMIAVFHYSALLQLLRESVAKETVSPRFLELVMKVRKYTLVIHLHEDT